ncbi:DUF3558 domain-containing protein [Pseudonocardia sp.]|uniref:DUF3558 domain-containing protein n=1 Tax=Pseudonocardia sp. TaxID=60912 RepID=UPI0034551B11
MMNSGPVSGLLASFVLVLALSACSTASSTPPLVVPPPPAEVTASAPPVSGVPTVDHPLDLRGIRACEALTAEMLQSLDLTADTASDRSNANASACGWTARDGSFEAGIALSTVRDLRLYYSLRTSFPIFEPEVISGYPAVRVSDVNSGSCVILVGNADDQSFSARAGGFSGPLRDLCVTARDVASAALTSLPPRR